MPLAAAPAGAAGPVLCPRQQPAVGSVQGLPPPDGAMDSACGDQARPRCPLGPARWLPTTVPPADTFHPPLRVQGRPAEGQGGSVHRGHAARRRRSAPSPRGQPRCPVCPGGGFRRPGWHVCATYHPRHPSGHHSRLPGVPVALSEVAAWRQGTSCGFAACAAGSSPARSPAPGSPAPAQETRCRRSGRQGQPTAAAPASPPSRSRTPRVRASPLRKLQAL